MENSLLAALNEAVPFAKHAGVMVTRMDQDGAVALLPEAAFLMNHVASQHAGALFTVAEAASGAAMVAALSGMVASATPLVRDASIIYRKVARGPILAAARLLGDAAIFREALAADRSVDCEVDVRLTDREAVEVATVMVRWNVRLRG